ncbi:MAG TPA: nitronate monooxygenase family protein [Microvirga sp.]|jgi:nitronate monooxygenase|nr:nitronate monooxygenase family protein [Microvirga sp.]
MPLPASFEGRLTVPAIAAPMFLVSGPDLVVEACRSGVVGTFPALNQRSSEGYEAWLTEIKARLERAERESGRVPAPFGVNLIVHRTNARLQDDLALTVKHRVPLVITSLGAVSDLVDAVHSYGGIVLHDVINLRHAEKALQAGVDGIIAVAAGAGGHAGTLSPFAFVAELRALTDKMIALSGSISHGREIAAARLLGADLAYLGTRFIATRESMAQEEYKTMLLSSSAKDVVYTPAISGINANFLRPSIAAAGLDPDNLPTGAKLDMGHERKAWKNVWSAGQGTGSIADVPYTAELCGRLAQEYEEALALRPSLSLTGRAA